MSFPSFSPIFLSLFKKVCLHKILKIQTKADSNKLARTLVATIIIHSWAHLLHLYSLPTLLLQRDYFKANSRWFYFIHISVYLKYKDFPPSVTTLSFFIPKNEQFLIIIGYPVRDPISPIGACLFFWSWFGIQMRRKHCTDWYVFGVSFISFHTFQCIWPIN